MEAQSSVTVPRAPALSGWFLGSVGVLAFSLSLPANALAVVGMSPVAVTVWRAGLAGVLAAGYLVATRAPLPSRGWPSLVAAGLGVAVGFPLLASIALQSISPARAAVVLGMLPALTAVFARLLGGPALPWTFWCATGAGAVVLVAYLTSRADVGAPGPGPGDLAMLGATASSALGYALGARQAVTLGGPQSVCWSLVLLLPASLPASAVVAGRVDVAWTGSVVVGFAYLVVVSQLMGFFAWYAGLARGGIARVGQVQQVQPVLTVLWSGWLFAGGVDPVAGVVGAVLAGCVAVAQRARFAEKNL